MKGTISFALVLIAVAAQADDSLRNTAGLVLRVDRQSDAPVLHLTVPGEDGEIRIIVPEHVTARRRGEADAQHLYMSTSRDARVVWQNAGRTFFYERQLPNLVHLHVTATLEEDGVLFEYRVRNTSNVGYDMIYAVTDPRMTGVFHDERLERTYVHHSNGFDLLASETRRPHALPARYLVSYTWPVPARLVEKRSDGITYYNKSRRVDAAWIATLSRDGRWVVASTTNTAGNVWSNPELTCQHVDPQAVLEAMNEVTLRVKLLVVKGSLADAWALTKRSRSSQSRP